MIAKRSQMNVKTPRRIENTKKNWNKRKVTSPYAMDSNAPEESRWKHEKSKKVSEERKLLQD